MPSAPRLRLDLAVVQLEFHVRLIAAKLVELRGELFGERRVRADLLPQLRLLLLQIGELGFFFGGEIA